MSRIYALMLFALWTTPVRAESAQRIPVVLHLTADADAALAGEAFVREQIARANEIFTPLGVELVLQQTLLLPTRHAALISRGDRDALARYVQRGAIHWFVVDKLMDVDEPGRERRGVHWHLRSDARRHFVVVSKISGPYVFAHELGHYFGNPEHSPTPGNLMSYERGEGAPSLDPAQISNLRATLARLLKTRELVALPGSLDAGLIRD